MTDKLSNDTSTRPILKTISQIKQICASRKNSSCEENSLKTQLLNSKIFFAKKTLKSSPKQLPITLVTSTWRYIFYRREIFNSFREFILERRSEENLEFLLHVLEFQIISQPLKKQKHGEKIYSKYIANSAPKQLNLDEKLRFDIRDRVSRLTIEIFDEAFQACESTLELELWPQFVRKKFVSCGFFCGKEVRRCKSKGADKITTLYEKLRKVLDNY
eukprot:TRINITY_DN10606_c0_g1_i1.p1 TRINITY_DN10606_c0_g1~~TRINITY_DN10606_c0_g1_i1.p1  ORF type:complete len:217 (+),score=32.81 TRINITY_DN10606_c0_g1_i1:63-713(+)